MKYIQLTNLDWLSFTCLMTMTQYEYATEPILQQPEGYVLQYFSGTNLFKRRAILFSEYGDKILTLLYQPHSNIIDASSLFVEVANKVLYCRYDYILDLLQQIHSIVWGSLSRIDIATDFNPTRHQQFVIDGLQSGELYISGKREGSLFHDYKQGQKIQRVARCMSWGSKYSDVKFKLYNKTKEIHEIDANGRTWINKPYIVNQWESYGLNPNNVWRLEASIMGASAYTWHDEKLNWNITTPVLFTDLFYDLVAHRFTIRKNEGHQNKRYDHIVNFLQIPDVAHYRLRKADPEEEQRHTDHASTLRNLIKELEKPETQCNETIVAHLLNTTRAVIGTARLDGYFLRAMGLNFEEWEKQYLEKLPIH